MIKDDIKKRIQYEKSIEYLNLIDISSYTSYGYYLFNKLVVPEPSKIINITEYEGHKCLNIAYEDFKKLYKKLQNDSLKNLIPYDSMFHINKFKIIRSYEPYISKYKNYLYELYQNFKYFTMNKKIHNFDDFLISIENFILYTNNILTFSSFVKSKKCDSYSTGLLLKYSNNTNEQILNDSNFEYFNNICNQHNFFIDKNDLSKIIYLLENKAEYIESYNFIYENDLILFLVSLYTLYDYYYEEYLKNKIDNNKLFTFKRIFSLYFKIKLKESNIKYNKVAFDKRLIEFYYVLGLKDVAYVTNMIHNLTNN